MRVEQGRQLPDERFDITIVTRYIGITVRSRSSALLLATHTQPLRKHSASTQHGHSPIGSGPR